MPPEELKFLHDIAQACGLLQQFTVGKTVHDFRDDALLRSAVERQFIIVGEALLQALRLHPDLAKSITNSRRIVNFRNVIVHGYAQVVPDTVWGMLEKHLPKLHDEVQSLLRQ